MVSTETKRAAPSIAVSTGQATDPLALVNEMAGGQTKKGKKDSKPDYDSTEVQPLIEQYRKQKAAAETATALMNAAKDQIVERVRPFRLRECVRAGKVLSSVTVCGQLTFTQQKRYKDVAEQNVPILEDAFGDDCERFFCAKLKISLADSAANNEDVLKALIERLGPEFFRDHFVVRRDRVVQEAFHTAYSTDPGVQAIATPLINQGIIEPYAPSLKVK